MAKAGDGEARSGKRRLTKTISLRVSEQEKRRFEEIAERNGFPGLTAWALDQMRSGQGINSRTARILCGKLGALGSQLNTLSVTAAGLSPDQLQHELQAQGKRVLAMQRDIVGRDFDAG